MSKTNRYDIFNAQLNDDHVQLKPCHLNSTNLSHLGAILDVAEKLEVVSLLKPFSWHVGEDKALGQPASTVVVDVVTFNGWFKVIARNPTALHAAWKGIHV